VCRPRFVLLLFVAMAAPFAGAEPIADLRVMLQRYPAKARFAASASLRVDGQAEEAGARAGAVHFEVVCDGGLSVRLPSAALLAAAAEAQRKKHDADSATPTRNAMVTMTIFDVVDALDVAAMLLNDLDGATLISQSQTPSGRLLRIKVKPDLAGTRSRLVNEPIIELRVWLNDDGVPVAAERDSTYSASLLFVKAANVRKERWEIAAAGDRLYASRADQSNRASAAGKTLASSRSVTFEPRP
jgi:hypothetical protein